MEASSGAGGILVVVPTLNEAQNVEKVVLQLVREAPAFPAFILAVVDGGSSDDTVAIADRLAARHEAIKVMHNPKRIQSAAVNLAVRKFGQDAEYLVRCDAHSVYPESYVERLIGTLVRTNADSVVIPMDSVGRNCIEKAVAWVSDTPLGSGGAAHRGGSRSGFVDHGHHAAFRMSAFASVAGYDETFTHNEDAEFDCRLNASGGRIFLDSEIRIGYHPRGSLRSLFRQYFNYGKGRSRTVRRHPGTIRARQLAVPGHVLLSILAVLVSPITLWPLALPALYFFVLFLCSVHIAVKKRSLCGLLSGPAAGVMHTAWAFGFFWGLLSVRERVWTRSDPSLNVAIPSRS